MRTFLSTSWAKIIFSVGVVLSLVCIIPAVWFPLQLGKITLFSLCALVGAILFFVSGGVARIHGKRGVLPALLVGLLPVAYVLSYLFSTDRAVGFLGYSVEGDTVMFIVLGFIAFILSSYLFRELAAARILLVSVVSCICAAVAFQCVLILLGTKGISWSVFSGVSVNLVGKWNDLGLAAGLALCVLVVWLACGELSRVKRLGVTCAVLVLTLFLAIVQFPLVWALLVGSFFALALWMYVNATNVVDNTNATRVRGLKAFPWLPLAAGVVSGLFLLWGVIFQGGFAQLFSASSLEVRPSLSSTLDVVRSAHGTSVTRFLVGTGPNTFSDAWFLYKSAEVSKSQFWNLDFTVGFSTFTTALGTVGVLGALAWLIPLLFVVLGLVRVMRLSSVFSLREKISIFSLGVSSIYAWCSVLFYVPSQNIVLLAFVLSGAVFGLSMKEVPGGGDMSNHPYAHLYTRLLQGIFILCVVVLVALSGVLVRRFIGEAYVNKGLYALSQNNADDALLAAAHALKIETTADALHVGVVAGLAKMQQLVSIQAPSQDVQAHFVSLTQATITAGQEAIRRTPGDYRTYFALARVYDVLASIEVSQAYENAKALYMQAYTYNPTNPEIPLAVARLESVHGNSAAVTAALTQALTLKPDYTDAILFVVQLNVVNKDIPNAIVAARAAVNSAPGVPSIWFELGLLYYSAGNMKDAATALAQAVVLAPQYANAKYFLGLAYAALGRTSDAVVQFKDLQASNPDNTEVAFILGNLESGKAPFDGAKAPVTPTPQNRATAPVSQ
ncbi:MAG: tetratricopeptide repeat protein [Candidatus Adlerbacteria bacterium]|nr:tetratricopeptide repeat protein [Candidatus Adlerbacteria bacterium]